MNHDTLTHYGDTIERLEKENAQLQKRIAELEKDAERLRSVLFAYGEANEATQHPYWLVLRNGVLRACDAVLAGPFFSRDAAVNHMNARSYEYGKKAYVYCFSGHWSRQYKDLRDAAIAAQRQKAGE